MATYDDLLALDNKLKTRQKQLQLLAIEKYRSKNKLKPSFMWNSPYSRRRRLPSQFQT